MLRKSLNISEKIEFGMTLVNVFMRQRVITYATYKVSYLGIEKTRILSFLIRLLDKRHKLDKYTKKEQIIL